MPAPSRLRLDLSSEADTAHRACQLARRLAPGDTVLLAGPVGAGKTHFARSLITSILRTPEDIPSPTFTLVQTYETTRGPLWHCDLYRLSSPAEVEELGLLEAFGSAICLVEWPDRLGDLRPDDGLTVDLDTGVEETARCAMLVWQDGKWDQKLQEWRA